MCVYVCVCASVCVSVALELMKEVVQGRLGWLGLGLGCVCRGG